jgi:hypothetical protein
LGAGESADALLVAGSWFWGGYFDADACDSRFDHAQFACSGRADIDDPSPDKWTAIGNPHRDTSFVSQVGNANNAAKRQRPVGGGQPSGSKRSPLAVLLIRAPAAAGHQGDGDHQGNDRQVGEHELFECFLCL